MIFKKLKSVFMLALITLFVILFVNLVSASFEVGNLSHSIDKQYRLSDFLRGWINISLDNEPINSLFRTSLGERAELIELIMLNNLSEGADYTCVPTDCEIDYTMVSGTGETQKNFILNTDENIIFGLKISGGEIYDIPDFSMKVTSNAGESFTPQLYIDFLADSIIEWWSYKASGDFQPENYGCYQAPAEGQVTITSNEYCEKITLPAAPSVKIGAKVNEVSGAGQSAEFSMSISSEDYIYYGLCSATASGTGKISCIPDNFMMHEEGDFFVCISSGDDEEYTINHETENPCGFTISYPGEYTRDFEIFARAGTYDEIGSVVINTTELANAGFPNPYIEDNIWNYINTRYDGNCSNECIIPVKLISDYGASGTRRSRGTGLPIIPDNHEIQISNIGLTYWVDIPITTNKLYDLVEIPAKINSEFIRLDLDNAEFSVPSQYGDYAFLLRLDNQMVFSEDISIERFPEIDFLTPTTTAAAMPTVFEVVINTSNYDANITKYEWDFGDNSSAITEQNKINHTYETIGNYTLTIMVTDENNLSSSKSFNISVEMPLEAVRNSLDRKLADLMSVKSKIQAMPVFYQDSLYFILNLTEIENLLASIGLAYNSSTEQTSAQEYIDMMQGLLEIELPGSLGISITTEPILFYPKEENIDLDILQLIGGGQYDPAKENDYINTILLWNQDNLETKVSFEEITAIYENFNEPILRAFKLYINKKLSSEENPYIILQDLENLRFKEDYSENNKSGYAYILLAESEKTIEFLTTEDFDFVTLPLFISPPISSLSLITIEGDADEIDWKWTFFVLIMILLILVGTFLYVTLQKWYKKKYEKYLFKSKNDLYNIMTYINRMKNKDMANRDIAHNLRISRWNSEQIKYAMRKYSKKRTGMFEIPVEKILKKLKAKSREKKLDRY